MQTTINVNGQLLDLSTPQVMGILNVTPDSFYEQSRQQTDSDIRHRMEQILNEGATIVDIGACSTRPGAAEVNQAEEMRRLRHALAICREVSPTAILSVDTFRADVARMSVEEFGVQIVNDISGGNFDDNMFATVAKLNVPYVLTHNTAPSSATPAEAGETPLPASPDELLESIILYFAQRIQQLHDLGQKDILLDPGFGFGKTLQQNYQLLNRLEQLKIFGLPILVGVSRKSMIYRLLGTTPQDALNGTTVLHTLALAKDCAQVLRVHDVREAVETVRILSYNG